MLRRRASGTAGFFEDIPALIIVILTFVLFIGLAASIFQSTLETREYDTFAQEVNNFIEKVRGYEGLTHSGIVGLFDAHKVRNITASYIKRDLRPDYDFSITILDVSGYPFNCSMNLSSEEWNPDRGLEVGKSVACTSVAIWVSDEEIHAAKMVVAIWK